MTKEELQKLEPFLKTLTPEQQKVIWYIEARKKGNPCITEEEKNKALNSVLIKPKKIQFRFPIIICGKKYTDTGSIW